MKDAYYFSHDSNARNDQKIMKLRMKEGMAGYGIYWAIIEMLREQEGYSLELDDIDSIAFELRQERDVIERIVNDYNLFVIDDGRFYSESLSERMCKMDEIRKKRSMAGKSKKTKEKQKGNKCLTNDKQMINKSEQVKEKKGNEKKLNEKNIYAEFVSMTEAEYNKLLKRFGKERTIRAIEKLDNYKGSSGKKYKNDYRAILTWAIEQTPENKKYNPIV